MEHRNRHNSHALLLNVFACIAAVSLAVAIIGYSYFQFRAREEEAKQIQGAIGIMGETMKLLKEDTPPKKDSQQPTSSPAPVSSDPLLVPPPEAAKPQSE